MPEPRGVGTWLGRRAKGWVLAWACCGWACSGDGPESVDVDEQPQVEAVAPTLTPLPSIETADAWLDLVAQRPSAVATKGGRIVIDFGRHAARKHLAPSLSSPWRLGERIEQDTAGVLTGRNGTIVFPLDGPLSPALHPDLEGQPQLAMALELRSLASTEPPPAEEGKPPPKAPKQLVTVLVNERPLVNLTVGSTFARRTLSLPSHMIAPGENRVRLLFRHMGEWDGEPAAGAIKSMEVGTLTQIRAGSPEVEDVRLDPQTQALTMPPGSGLAYYTIPPRRSKLVVDAAGSGGFEVYVSTDEDHRDGRRPTRLFEAAIKPGGRAHEIDLSGYAGVPIRLELRSKGLAGQTVTVRSLEIVARRSVVLDQRAREPRTIIVLAVEGARMSDLVASKRPDGIRSPQFAHIERFLDEAVVFEDAHALGAEAVPSHAGLLSSIVPPVHLTSRGTFVAQGQILLAEVLDRAGYFCTLISANTDVNAERGLAQGFGDVELVKRAPSQRNAADVLVAKLEDELENRPRPIFAYATLSDPQAPYDPPEDIVGDVLAVRPETAPFPNRTHMWVGRVRLGKVEPLPEDLRFVRDLYLGELAVVDQALGTLLDTLTQRGELDDTIVALVGVHGEEFLEHGGAGHGRNLFQESIHVPLAIRAPGLLAPGRVEVPVDLLDVGPTLLDLAGVPQPRSWQGQTLVPLVDDPQPPPRLVVSSYGDGTRMGRVGAFKFILGPGVGVAAEHFYDLRDNPEERPALPPEPPPEGEPAQQQVEGGVGLRVVRTAMSWHLWQETGWKRARWGTGASLERAFSQDLGL